MGASPTPQGLGGLGGKRAEVGGGGGGRGKLVRPPVHLKVTLQRLFGAHKKEEGSM